MSNIVFPDCCVSTILTAPVQIDQLTIQVNSALGWPNLSLPENVGKRFLITVKRSYDNQAERMWVTATSGSTWTVERNAAPSCDATLTFTRGDLVISPFTPELVLAFRCFQQIED